MSAISRKRTRKEERNSGIADCGLRIADSGLRIADSGLLIKPQSSIRNPQSFGGPADDVVGRRRRSDIGHVVQLVRRLKDDPARTDAARRAALKGLERALLDDEQLFVRVLVRRVRRLARIERR